MVQEICRDIKKLDYAKQHLTQSITALRRFAMLCNAVGVHFQIFTPYLSTSRSTTLSSHYEDHGHYSSSGSEIIASSMSSLLLDIIVPLLASARKDSHFQDAWQAFYTSFAKPGAASLLPQTPVFLFGR